NAVDHDEKRPVRNASEVRDHLLRRRERRAMQKAGRRGARPSPDEEFVWLRNLLEIDFGGEIFRRRHAKVLPDLFKRVVLPPSLGHIDDVRIADREAQTEILKGNRSRADRKRRRDEIRLINRIRHREKFLLGDRRASRRARAGRLTTARDLKEKARLGWAGS